MIGALGILVSLWGCGEPCEQVQVFADRDRDGFGDDNGVGDGCADRITSLDPGFSFKSGDCDDEDPAVNPDADEVCDGVDNNCSGDVDMQVAYYGDLDQDGFGGHASVIRECFIDVPSPPPGYHRVADDCDDTNRERNPGAEEVCDGVDNDCDGVVDAEDPSITGAAWHADADGDGYGDPDAVLQACPDDDGNGPAGHIRDGSDCDDSNKLIHPGVGWDGAGGADLNCSETLEDTVAIWGSPGERLGIDLAVADFDGDGQDDLLAGAYLAGSTTQAGRVYLLYGPLSSGPVGSAGPAPLVLDGSKAQAHAGFGIGHAPADIDGDGVPEVAFGADNKTTDAGSKAGSVGVLFSGQRHSEASAADSLLYIDGDGFRGRLGRGLSFIGDTSGDGVPDLFAGATGYRDASNAEVGAAFLLSGSALASASRPDTLEVSDVSVALWGHQEDSALAYQGAASADFNGDGAADLITSAYLESMQLGGSMSQGAVYLLPGPITTDQHLDSTATVLYGEADILSRFGIALSAGDLDSDGYADALVGSLGGSGSATGRLWVIPGGSTACWDGSAIDTVADTISITGSHPEGGFGSAIEVLDADDDGHPDVLVSAKYWGSDTDNGAVFLFYGPLSGSRSADDADLFLPRSAASDSYVGEVLAVGGNLLGTTGPVAVIGAPKDAPDDTYQGGNGAMYLLDLSPP